MTSSPISYSKAQEETSSTIHWPIGNPQGLVSDSTLSNLLLAWETKPQSVRMQTFGHCSKTMGCEVGGGKRGPMCVRVQP